MTAVKSELSANSVSSMPGATEPAKRKARVSARHMPPSAITDD